MTQFERKENYLHNVFPYRLIFVDFEEMVVTFDAAW